MNQMHSLERLLGALAGEAVDRVPVVIPGGMMAGTLYELLHDSELGYPDIHTDPQAMAAYARLLRERCGIDNYGVPFCMTIEAEDFGAPVDLGTMIKEPRVTAYAVDKLAEVLQLAPEACPRHETTLEAIGLLRGEDVPVLGNLTGPVSLLTSLIEPCTAYKAMAREPELAASAFEAVTGHIADFARQQVAAGADVIVLAAPGASGEILGEACFRKFAAPMLQRVVAAAKDAGAPVILHICGDIMPVADALDDIAWDAMSVDSVVSLKRLKKRFPDRALMGNVSTHLLGVADPDKAFRSSTRAVEISTILAPACGLPTSTLTENIKAMVQAAKNASAKLGTVCGVEEERV